jgi:hypothetical protein
MNRLTIEDVENRVAARIQAFLDSGSLDPLIPQLEETDFCVRVTLVNDKLRKKRRDAAADSWKPEADRVILTFEPRAPATETAPAQSLPSPRSDSDAKQSDEKLDALIKSLDRAESKPGYNFVALKWFRDTALPANNIDSEVLQRAIATRIVLTGRVPNPRNPEFPTATVRLNRVLPLVQAALRKVAPQTPGFRPIQLRGAPLSETVQKSRR